MREVQELLEIRLWRRMIRAANAEILSAFPKSSRNFLSVLRPEQMGKYAVHIATI